MNANFLKKQTGVTLIEVMIVVTILGVLSSIAYPSYTSHKRKVQHTDGRNSLLNALTLQNRRRSANGAYVTDLALVGLEADGADFLSDEGYFSLTAAVCPNNNALTDCIQLTATPTSQAASGVQTLVATSIGERTPNELW